VSISSINFNKDLYKYSKKDLIPSKKESINNSYRFILCVGKGSFG